VVEGEVVAFLAAGDWRLLQDLGGKQGVEGYEVGDVDCGWALCRN